MISEMLKPSEKVALNELRIKLEGFIKYNSCIPPHFTSHNRKRNTCLKSCITSCSYHEMECTPKNYNISLWGVPLIPYKSNEFLDTILLKFLRAREFKPCEAFEMIQRTIKWRNEFGVDDIMKEDLNSEYFVETTYMDGFDREGHPICYNVYGSFREGGGDYEKAFESREVQERFLRWRVKVMEGGIQEFLSFKLGRASSMVQVIDLKNLVGSSMKEMRSVVEKMIKIFQDNYPEFIFKNIFLNVSLGYYTYRSVFPSLFTPRTQSKFVFARPSKVTETLLRYIEPENIPIQYGGFKREKDDVFLPEEVKISETFVKGGSITFVEIPTEEPGVTVFWDIIVVGWNVSYREEFIPNDEGSYTILIKAEKPKKPIRNSFYINEPGKLVFTIDNKSSKKKTILYRSKSKQTFPCYYSLGHPPVKFC